MIQILLLICSAALTPLPADYQPSTALDMIQGPTAASVRNCMFVGQAYVAQTRIRPRSGEYLVIKCVSRGRAGTVVSPATEMRGASPTSPPVALRGSAGGAFLGETE